MRIGCCVPVAAARAAAEAGFAFVELRVAELFPEESAERFRDTARAVEQAGIPALAYNFFLPSTLPVVGPEADHQRLARYVATAAERAAAIGGKVMVFGSGKARWIPAGFPPEQAAAQFRQAVRIAADQADRHGIAIALEHLNHTEANLLNRFDEALACCRAVDHPAVGVLADLYHLYMEQEPFHHVMQAGERLLHVHVCDAGRGVPGTRTFDLWGFFTHVNAMGYQGAVSVEASFSRFATEGRQAVQVLQEAVQARGLMTFAP